MLISITGTVESISRHPHNRERVLVTVTSYQDPEVGEQEFDFIVPRDQSPAVGDAVYVGLVSADIVR